MTTPLTTRTPDGPAKGGVVIIQEAFGVTPWVEGVCDRLAAAGWDAVAPHLFHRTGDPVFDYGGGFDRLAPHMGAMTMEGITEDVDTALEHLASVGLAPEQTGIIGFCVGGDIATVMGVTHALGAAVSFYGGGVAEGRLGMPALVDVVASLRTPWLGHYGSADPSIPVEQLDALRPALEHAALATELHVYDAGHGFANSDRPDVYAAPDAELAWSRTLAWLEAHCLPGS